MDPAVQSALMMMVFGYLCGSIPFGLLLTRLGGAGDIRTIGSGNIGATNVLRTGRKGLAIATLLLDLAKGAVAVCVARVISPDDMIVAGTMAVIGHLYPVWLRFRGGKGVATLMGVALAWNWLFGLIYALIWIGTIAATRISSLGGLLAAISLPVAAAFIGPGELLPAAAALAVLVLWRHRDNIRRLLSGTEPRIGRAATDNEAS